MGLELPTFEAAALVLPWTTAAAVCFHVLLLPSPSSLPLSAWRSLHNPRGCQAPVPMGNPRNSRKGDAYAAATPPQRQESSCCCCFLHGYPSRNCDTASHSLPYIETPQVEGCKHHREGFFDDDARARLHHAHDGHITNTDAPSLLYNIVSLDSLHKNHKLKNLLPLFSSSPDQQLIPKTTRTYILLSFSLPLPLLSPPLPTHSTPDFPSKTSISQRASEIGTLNSAAKRTIHFFDTTIFQKESTSLTKMRAHSLSDSRFAWLCTRA